MVAGIPGAGITGAGGKHDWLVAYTLSLAF